MRWQWRDTLSHRGGDQPPWNAVDTLPPSDAVEVTRLNDIDRGDAVPSPPGAAQGSRRRRGVPPAPPRNSSSRQISTNILSSNPPPPPPLRYVPAFRRVPPPPPPPRRRSVSQPPPPPPPPKGQTKQPLYQPRDVVPPPPPPPSPPPLKGQGQRYTYQSQDIVPSPPPPPPLKGQGNQGTHHIYQSREISRRPPPPPLSPSLRNFQPKETQLVPRSQAKDVEEEAGIFPIPSLARPPSPEISEQLSRLTQSEESQSTHRVHRPPPPPPPTPLSTWGRRTSNVVPHPTGSVQDSLRTDDVAGTESGLLRQDENDNVNDSERQVRYEYPRLPLHDDAETSSTRRPLQNNLPSNSNEAGSGTEQIDLSPDAAHEAAQVRRPRPVKFIDEIASPSKVTKPLYRSFMRTMSHLFLGLYSSPPVPSLPDATERDMKDVLARQITRAGMARTNVQLLISAISTGRKEFTHESENLLAQTRSVFVLAKPKPKKRRFRRKRKRRVPRATVLSTLKDYDRDLDDDEFECLVRDLERSPYTREEYEEIVEVDASQSLWEPWSFLPLSDWYSWDPAYLPSFSPLEGPEDQLTEEEKDLLFESSDAWQTLESYSDESRDDELTEMDLWILANSSSGVAAWVEPSDFEEDERADMPNGDEPYSVEAGRFEPISHQHHVPGPVDPDTSDTDNDRENETTSLETNEITKPKGQSNTAKASRSFFWFRKASRKDVRDESQTHDEIRVEEERTPTAKTIVPHREDTAKPEYDMNIGESATVETPSAFGGRLLHDDMRTGGQGHSSSPPPEFRYLREDN